MLNWIWSSIDRAEALSWVESQFERKAASSGGRAIAVVGTQSWNLVVTRIG